MSSASALYESLLPKLVLVMELAQKPEGTATPQAKQALLEATKEFKSALKKAKEIALNLPGGELLIREQDEVIDMLEKLKDRKREQLSQFAKCVLPAVSENNKMEVDSTASTPS